MICLVQIVAGNMCSLWLPVQIVRVYNCAARTDEVIFNICSIGLG